MEGTIMNTTNNVVNRTIYEWVKIIESEKRFVKYNVGVAMPPKIVSDGLWADPAVGSIPSDSTLTMLHLQIITIFTLTQCFHFALKRIGFPYFVSQLMAGFVLGPSLKIDALTKYKKMLFPYGSEDTLALLSIFGYTMFLFLNAVQMDFTMVTRTGRRVWAIAITTVGVPVAIGLTVFYKYRRFWHQVTGDDRLDVVVIGHSGCSFAVIASLLSDLDILNSELGRLALSSALVSDLLTSIGIGVGTVYSVYAQGVISSMLKPLAIFFAFLILVPFIGRPVMMWVVRNTPEGRPVKRVYTLIIVLTALGLGSLTRSANQALLSGVALFGFVVPEGPPLGSELVKQFELLNIWVFLPLFVTTSAMKVDITIHGNMEFISVVLSFIGGVHLIKMALCMGIGGYCKMPKTDAFCLALILSCKGVVDVSTFLIIYDDLKISSETASLMLISSLVLGSISRIGLNYFYDPSRKYAGYQKRNILHLKPNSDLRIVACIQKPSHIIPIRNLLDLCCPTPTNPIVVDVLHLMELVGRSSPIFISHRLQERVCSGHHNFSGDVIVTFDLFEHDHAGAVMVNIYTAISPQRLMHEDICHLALDKLASIIVLPFHVRWGDDGSVESEDESIRALNNKVLKRAPCSVGILVNRGPSNHNSSNQIAMIFLGGADDREALCLAKRTIKECGYTLVVYHLVGGSSDSSNWDVVLDQELLKGVKGYYGIVENVTYQSITIEDPSQIISFLSSIANQHDFIIVGRRNGIKSPQTAALNNWVEYSELGMIGDLLAAPDTNTKASILVVQQQLMPKSSA